MQIYFHSRLWSYLPRVPILVEDTVYPRPSLWRATILILKSSEFFAMRCHVENLVVSMRELFPKHQILTALIQDTQICIVLSSRQKHEHDE